MPECFEALQPGNFQEINSQEKELLVSASGPVGVSEWADDKAILLVIHEVAPQVINHDCVLCVVGVRKLSPQEGQGLALKEPCMYKALEDESDLQDAHGHCIFLQGPHLDMICDSEF